MTKKNICQILHKNLVDGKIFNGKKKHKFRGIFEAGII
jgi:hypothetical protein